jgi:hypothetical protein
MSIGTFCLRTIVIELQTKKNSMVKKKMEKNNEKRHLTYGSWNILEIVKRCKLFMYDILYKGLVNFILSH